MAQWTEKYRPDMLDGIVGQDGLVQRLKNRAKTPIEDITHMLFYGLTGTGKTTAARAFCKAIGAYKEEINAAEINDKKQLEKIGHDMMNTGAINFNDYDEKTNTSKTKGTLYIFDKAEKMTENAQAEFESYLDDSTFGKAIFICNDASKLTKEFRRRLSEFVFEPVKDGDMGKLVAEIAKQEDLNVPEKVVQQIISESEGIPGKAINKLQEYKLNYS